MAQGQKEIDINAKASERKGIAGLFETFLRKMQNLSHFLMLIPFYAFGSCILGLALLHSIFAFFWIKSLTTDLGPLAQYFWTGSSLAMGYFLYGFSLILLVPLMNFFVRAKLKEWRGPYYSLPAIQWYIHNGLTYLVRYTFLEFITPTPLNLFFFAPWG